MWCKECSSALAEGRNTKKFRDFHKFLVGWTAPQVRAALFTVPSKFCQCKETSTTFGIINIHKHFRDDGLLSVHLLGFYV